MENVGLNGYIHAFLEKEWEVLGIIQDGHFFQTPHSLGFGDIGKNFELVRIIQYTDLLRSNIAASSDTTRLGSATYKRKPRNAYLLFAHEEFVLHRMSFAHKVYIRIQILKLSL
jgi:hypothetical protein